MALNRDPFAEYVQGMKDRFSNRNNRAAPSSSSGGYQLTPEGSTSELGTPTNIKLTGGQDIAQGTAGLPAASGVGGQSGFVGGGGPRRAADAGGPSDLGLIKQAVDAAIKSGRFGKEFLPARGQDVAYDPIATGAATVQGIEGARALTGSPLSTIDLGIGAGAAAPNVPTSFGDLSKLVGQGYSMEDISQILGGAEAVGAGGVGAGAGAASTLGTVGGGAAALGAILSLLAQATGDPEIAKAAQAVGVGASGVGLAGTAASLAPFAGMAAGAAAPTGIAAGLGGGAATGLPAAGAAGLGTAAGAAFAPIAAALLIDAFGPLFGKEEGTIGIAGGIADQMKRSAGDYPFFGEKLAQTTGQQGQAFGTLEQALPYVQSKEELGQLLNTYRNYLGTTTGVEPEMYGGDIYGIAKTPGTTGFEHGQQGPQIDWGPRTQALNEQVQALLGVLPGNQITARYGEPGGGLEGEPARRLWQQFFPMTGGDVASRTVGGGPGAWSFSEGGTPAFIAQPGTQEFASYTGPDSPYTYYGMQDITNAMNAGTMAGPSWDPATGQLVYTRGGTPPKPSDYFQVSPYWQQLVGQQQADAAQRTQIAQRALGAAGGGGTFPGGAFGPTGALSEEDRRRLGVR